MGGTASLAASWGHNLPTSTSRNCWNCSFNVILGDIRGSEGIKHTLLLFLTRVQQLGKQKLLFVCLFVCWWRRRLKLCGACCLGGFWGLQPCVCVCVCFVCVSVACFLVPAAQRIGASLQSVSYTSCLISHCVEVLCHAEAVRCGSFLAGSAVWYKMWCSTWWSCTLLTVESQDCTFFKKYLIDGQLLWLLTAVWWVILLCFLSVLSVCPSLVSTVWSERCRTKSADSTPSPSSCQSLTPPSPPPPYLTIYYEIIRTICLFLTRYLT